MASNGYLSEKTCADIFCGFGFWDYLFALHCCHARAPAARTEDRLSEKVVDRQTEQERAYTTTLIEERLTRISDSKGYALERENLSVDAEARSFSLPTEGATDKFSGTRLTWTVNFIVPWTNWSVCNVSAQAKMYSRPSTSILGRRT